jgi:hypothetical protein
VALVVFLAGSVSVGMCLFAMDVQKDYYRNARDLKTRFESDLGLGDRALATTPSMGALRERFGRVTTFQIAVLVALLIADLVGLGVSIQHALRSTPRAVEAAFEVSVTGSGHPSQVPVVFSHDGKVAAAIAPAPGVMTLVRLDPGTYAISAIAVTACSSTRTVSQAPLQQIVMHCHTPVTRRIHRRHPA